MDSIKKIKVLYNGVVVGYLGELEDSRIGFQYDENWIKTGFSISPISLPLSNEVFISSSSHFEGLFGVFYDSLPDGWGEYVIRRKLMQDGIDYDKLSPLTKLSLVNGNGLGGLNYLPTANYIDSEYKDFDLDDYAKSVSELLNDNNSTSLDELFKLGGSSGGARPKAHINDWIIKFPTNYDPKNIGELEYQANNIAKECGVKLPEYKLFESKICTGYFGSRRFDRDGIKRVHMISLAAILETTHRIPNMDYIHLFKVIKLICKEEDLYEAFRRMCFNVLYNNKDDHSKNFSFIYDEKIGRYRLSPAYDLTPTPNKLEHEMTVNGNGNPTEKDILQVAKVMNLSLNKCKNILAKLKSIIGK